MSQSSSLGVQAHAPATGLKRYEGRRTGGRLTVTADGSRPLNPRFDLRNHSPDGFEWGYGGSGPAQLALALLADCLDEDQQALSIYQDFKWKVVATLPRDGWRLTDAQIRQRVQSLAAK